MKTGVRHIGPVLVCALVMMVSAGCLEAGQKESPGGLILTFKVDTSALPAGVTPEEVADRMVAVWKARLKGIGVKLKRADIRENGMVNIVVPHESDAGKVIAVLAARGLLSFRLVDDSMAPNTALDQGPPDGAEVLYGFRVNATTGKPVKTPYLVRKRAILTGGMVEEAKAETGKYAGMPNISIRFDKNGAERFERITAANVKKRLAIVLDGRVLTAPVIQEKISGGRAVISGFHSMEEARDKALLLNTGPLPAPVTLMRSDTLEGAN